MDILEQLIRDEGLKQMPYRDSVGKLTIGVGRNLDDVGISWEEAMFLLANDVKHAKETLFERFPWSQGLDDVRQGVLINLCFNMGIAGLAQFKNMLKQIENKQYPQAAQSLMQSLYAKQVGDRARRLAIQLESGEWQ